MNKLQRYWAEESGIYGLTTDDCDMGETCRLVCKDADVSTLEAENERLRNDNAVLRDLAAAANPPKLSPEQLQRLRDLEQEKP